MMSSRIIKKQSITARQIRFTERNSLSPSPGAYNILDFTDKNKIEKKGATFGHSKKLNEKLPTSSNPGPGAYSALNP